MGHGDALPVQRTELVPIPFIVRSHLESQTRGRPCLNSQDVSFVELLSGCAMLPIGGPLRASYHPTGITSASLPGSGSRTSNSSSRPEGTRRGPSPSLASARPVLRARGAGRSTPHLREPPVPWGTHGIRCSLCEEAVARPSRVWGDRGHGQPRRWPRAASTELREEDCQAAAAGTSLPGLWGPLSLL